MLGSYKESKGGPRGWAESVGKMRPDHSELPMIFPTAPGNFGDKEGTSYYYFGGFNRHPK